jgi:hypothetical protein
VGLKAVWIAMLLHVCKLSLRPTVPMLLEWLFSLKITIGSRLWLRPKDTKVPLFLQENYYQILKEIMC